MSKTRVCPMAQPMTGWCLSRSRVSERCPKCPSQVGFRSDVYELVSPDWRPNRGKSTMKITGNQSRKKRKAQNRKQKNKTTTCSSCLGQVLASWHQVPYTRYLVARTRCQAGACVQGAEDQELRTRRTSTKCQLPIPDTWYQVADIWDQICATCKQMPGTYLGPGASFCSKQKKNTQH